MEKGKGENDLSLTLYSITNTSLSINPLSTFPQWVEGR
jgi:hypothetical protein